MTNDIKAKGTVRIYNCGGTGVNIGNHFTSVHGNSDTPGSAQVLLTFVDTSPSNLAKVKLPKENIYLIPGCDGAGKIRSQLVPIIDKHIKPILLEHKPCDFNVFVFSLGGGSGNILGLKLMLEVLQMGRPSVAVVVGSTDSTKELENTINSLKSLDGVARENKIPFTVAYFENEQGKPLKDVDQKAHFVISALTMLASRRNDRLDTEDIATWLNFPKTTNVSARLSNLTVTGNFENVGKTSDIISVASLYAPGVAPSLPFSPDYRCDGEFLEAVEQVQQMHYLIDIGTLNEKVNTLVSLLDERQRVRAARMLDDSIVNATDKPTSGGMVY